MQALSMAGQDGQNEQNHLAITFFYNKLSSKAALSCVEHNHQIFTQLKTIGEIQIAIFKS